MKHLLALGAVACAVLPSICAAADVKLTERETIVLPTPVDATAAFAVDSSTVEASVSGGRVTLLARRAGQTLVTVVTPTAVETLVVQVGLSLARFAPFESLVNPDLGSWQMSYDSGSKRTINALSMPFREGEEKVKLHLQAAHDGRALGGEKGWALPEARLEYKSPAYSLVLFDDPVNMSPLTLRHALVRGLHWRKDGWQVHTGVSLRTPWSSLLLPKEGDHTTGVSYSAAFGSVKLTPSLLWLPDSKSNHPAVASMGVAQGGDTDPLQYRAELAWSGKPGISFDTNVRRPERHLWLQGAYRPGEFAALDVARPAGTYLDGGWSERLAPNQSLDLSASATRLDLNGYKPESTFARGDWRFIPAPGWSTTAGLSAGHYSDQRSSASLRRSTMSLGASYDAAGFGVSSVYRYLRSSAATTGGHGARLTLRGNQGGWRGHVYVDAQQQSPNVDILLNNRPDLARAMALLGLAAGSPEELVRLLRDNASLLAQNGVSIGSIQLDELRVLGGLDLSWRPHGSSRASYGLRANVDRGQGSLGQALRNQATLYAGWRIQDRMHLELSYSAWGYQAAGMPRAKGDSVQVVMRVPLSSNGMPGRGGRSITGRVYRDDAATGLAQADQPALAGIEVVLDGSRRTVTDREGRFEFHSPGTGEHRVVAMLPSAQPAYFTTPSAVTALPGSEVGFSLSYAAARLSGRVLSDAGVPLSGVTLQVQGTSRTTTSTDSSGHFRFAGPPGEVSLSVLPESLPPGYELVQLAPLVKLLRTGAPAEADIVIRAQRAVEGRVLGASGKTVSVVAVEAGRSVQADENGRFLLRGLPAGALTLVVKNQDGEAHHPVVVPAQPGVVSGVELGAPCGQACTKPSIGSSDTTPSRRPVRNTIEPAGGRRPSSAPL